MKGTIIKPYIGAISAGIIITLGIIGAITIVPNLIGNQELNGNDDNEEDNLTIGFRIASYIDSRSSDILFTWSFNNSIVNTNFTDQVGGYVDGVLTYGSHINGSISNASVVGQFETKTEQIPSSTLKTVFIKFETAMVDLNKTSDSIKGFDDIEPWPPTFVWDIAFNDNSSISLIYSKEQHVLAAFNGTWTASEFGLSWTETIEFPQFEYEFNQQEVPIPFLILSEKAEIKVLKAIKTYVDSIASNF